ncbi:hypothetical protein F5Y00DRAFT_260383 [Daldinia vernicosa]|uniref:uncharacterized protein n=1 Tax=Daldinia vernicosa TaxID=114800 RepID=UPI002008312D|nr:uncharacterized protein F5Y00DRAFT_260383 [Daldinia vernicosa]KAI0850509.1 hypothetical protein F5Y00DRAFT_260383 [Daldinia vernicosa]
MAVDEEASLWPTENLLLKEGRKHYRTSVSPIHWQLRSLVSAEQQGVIYFPAGVNNTHIQRLDTSTRECETIKVISFHPRCLVASKGWICCGGENGEFVVIRESGNSDAQADTLSRDVRSRLTSLESSSMTEGTIYQLERDMLSVVERINGTNKTWSASSYKIGIERVNCITIWHPPKDAGAPAPGQYESPVAVVANNDKSITIVSLYEPDLHKDVLNYPDCVNRGVISPDGSLLAAVCDDAYLYVHAREQFDKNYEGISRRVTRQSSRWVLLPKIRLKGQWKDDATDCRGSFAACFSSSGKYLAVGTQYGTISIFDAVKLKDPDSEPLIAYFNSARAPGEYGAVRDMAFSPGPFDLLAWSEHRGRIGVADARSNFKRRHIIPIDNHEGFNHFSLNDSSTIDPRLLDPRSEQTPEGDRNADNERNAESSPLGAMDRWNRAASDRRPLPDPETSDPTSRVNQPFSADEISILEAFQAQRRRRELRDRGEQLEQHFMEHRNQRAAERNALRSTGWADRVSVQNGRTRRANVRNPIARYLYSDQLGLNRTNTDVEQREALTRFIERERMREIRDQHRSSATQAAPEPERERGSSIPRDLGRSRTSIMRTLAQNFDTISQTMRSQNQYSEAGNDSSATSRDPWYVGGSGSGWPDLENLASISGWTGGLTDNARTETNRARRGIPVIADVWGNDSLFSRIRMGSRDHTQNPDDTAGLTWSEDGQVLYVAAEDGIYEFRVNIYGRKVFPDIQLR